MPAVATALWRRLDTPGHDACVVEEACGGWLLHGTAVFRDGGAPACLAYRVTCDAGWATMRGEIAGHVRGEAVAVVIERHPTGWMQNGIAVPGLGALVDLDLGFTPATNYLHVRRVALPLHRPVSLPVAWLDTNGGLLRELPQTYERRGPQAIAYRAPGVGYEAVLEMAPNRFVRLYPGLWELEASS